MRLSEQLQSITIIRRRTWIKVILENLFIRRSEMLSVLTPLFKSVQIQLETHDGTIKIESLDVPLFHKELISIVDTTAHPNENLYTISLCVHEEGGERPVQSYKCIKKQEENQ